MNRYEKTKVCSKIITNSKEPLSWICLYDHSYRSSRYVLRLFHPWLLKELDFVREARKNYCKYIDIFTDI